MTADLDLDQVTSLVRHAWSTQLRSVTFTDGESFFMIGGDSLKAVRVMKALSRAAGRKLGVRLIFENPTVDDLSRTLATILLHASPTPAS